MAHVPTASEADFNLGMFGRFVKFDDVTVWISNKEENCPIGQFYSFGDRNLTSSELPLNYFKVINLKC